MESINFEYIYFEMLKFTISFKVALNELYDISDAKPILTEVTLRAAIWEGLIWPKFIQI